MNVNIDAIEVLNKIAEQIGTTVPTIMQWYIDQMGTLVLSALLLYFGFFLSAAVAVVCLKQIIKIQNKQHRMMDDDFGYWLCFVGIGAITLMFLTFALIETVEVIKAYLSPEAYALDRILSNFK